MGTADTAIAATAGISKALRVHRSPPAKVATMPTAQWQVARSVIVGSRPRVSSASSTGRLRRPTRINVSSPAFEIAPGDLTINSREGLWPAHRQVGCAWNIVLRSVQRRGVPVGRNAGWCCGEAIGVTITSGKSGNIFRLCYFLNRRAKRSLVQS